MCSMSSTGKPKLVRSSNFSTKEQHVLISLISKYKNIIECKESDTNSNRKKNAAWKALCAEFNSMCGETARDVTVLKNKYNNLKKRAKGNFAQERSNAFGTGGGPSDPSPVTELDIQIKEIIGKQVTGDDSIFDSDATDDHPTREKNIEVVGTEVVDETITNEINDSDGKNELSDEIQEEVSSNVLRLQTKWNSPGVPKRNKTPLRTPHGNLKNKLSQWSAQKTECAVLQKEFLREEHDQKLRHNEERHQIYLQECNLRMQHMQEKHDLELQLLKKSLQ